jgi:hypothetical protein
VVVEDLEDGVGDVGLVFEEEGVEVDGGQVAALPF